MMRKTDLGMEEGGARTWKRRRLSHGSVATVACDRCRRQKVKCSEERPTCAACQSKGLECVYEASIEDGESRQKALKRELDVARERLHDMEDGMAYLKSAAATDSHRLLQLIRTAEDPVALFTSLKQGSPDDNALTLAQDHGHLARELFSTHHAAYPSLLSGAEFSASADIFPRFELLATRFSGLETGAIQPLRRSSTLEQPSPASSDSHSPLNILNNPARHSPKVARRLCDERLYRLEIGQWTNVQISSEIAANIISLYLETDHPVLGFFDAELFLAGLCGGYSTYCSRFLVSALLYWGSHAYTALDVGTARLRAEFLREAQSRWELLRDVDSVTTVAACMIIGLGLACDGDDELAGSFKLYGAAMGKRLRMFHVSKPLAEHTYDESATGNDYRYKAHVAWGAYNWLCLHASYYHEQPATGPPSFFIPESNGGENIYPGNTFRAVCRFRRIMAGVINQYHADNGPPVAERVPFSFAESKYQELLSLSDSLKPTERRHSNMPHHVMVFHIWFHTAIIDIFRPFTSRGLHLHTLATKFASPEKVCELSLEQLKSLMVQYCHTQPSASYSILWHTALLYLGNSGLRDPQTSDWRFYFDICINSYSRLCLCYPIAAGILQGLLSIGLRSGTITKREAHAVLARLLSIAKHVPAPISSGSSHIVDFDLAQTDIESATVDALARSIESILPESNAPS